MCICYNFDMTYTRKNILLIGGIITFIAFFGVPQTHAQACNGPCTPGSPQTGPQIYGNPQGGGFAMPTTYASSNEAPYSAPIPKIDYSQTFVSPGLPTIYGNNGQGIVSNTNNNTSTNSTANQNTENTSIFGGLFGNKKTFGSQENTVIENNLTASLNTKGLALGSSSGSFCAKNEVEYIVLFKNITKGTLSNVAVRMYLPDEVVFKQTSMGNYSAYDHSVTAFLGTLQSGQSGQFLVSGSVVKSEINSVARAEMVYTKIDGTQDMVISYAFQNDQDCDGRNSNLAGFAGGSGFFPTTLFGWLILSIILCAVIYFARFFKKKKLEEAHGHHPVIAH